MNHILGTVGKSAVGLSGSVLAVILPWQENLEWGLRVAGAFAGLIVAVLSIVSLWRGISKK